MLELYTINSRETTREEKSVIVEIKRNPKEYLIQKKAGEKEQTRLDIEKISSIMVDLT